MFGMRPPTTLTVCIRLGITDPVAAQESLIPPGAGFDIGDTDERLWVHCFFSPNKTEREVKPSLRQSKM